MCREIHPERKGRAATIAAMVLAVLLAALLLPGLAAAQANYKLADINVQYLQGTVDPNGPVRIDRITTTPMGGAIEFTHSSQDQSAKCAGATQHFTFEWEFSRNVSILSGNAGDPQFTMRTTWFSDEGTACLDENPWTFVYVHGYGDLDPPEFVNSCDENRIYPRPDPKCAPKDPTFIMRDKGTPLASFDIQPSIRWLGANMVITYVYDPLPDSPTVTPTTVPQTAVGTITTVPGGTTPGTGGSGGGGCSWTGTWETNYGQMTLSQSGNRVTGTYTWDSGKIEGVVSGNTLTGRWSEAPSYTEPNDAGQFVFTMAPDCNSFTGTVGYGSSSTGLSWTGTKTGGTVITPVTSAVTSAVTTTVTTPSKTPTGGGTGSCSWSGTWSTSYGAMTLSQSGSQVTGTYATDDGRIEGTVSGNTLTGRWSESPSYKEPNDAGEFSYTMASDCGSFSGTWGYGTSSTGGSWSGTKTLPVSAPPTTTAIPSATRTAEVTAIGGPTGGSGGTGQNGCPASGMLLYIDPWTPAPGQTVEIPVWCCNAQDLANMDLTVLYNPAVLTFVSARKGGLLDSGFLFESNDLGGQVRISFAGTKGVSGSGAIAILTFKVAGSTGSSTTIGTTVNTASNSNGGSLTVPTQGGTVTVTPPNPNNPEGRPCGPTALTALKALQMSVGKIPVDMAYDVTRDGTVNSADARELLRLATEEVCVL